MTAHCCTACPHPVTCADLVNAAFARPGDITDDEPNIVRGAE